MKILAIIFTDAARNVVRPEVEQFIAIHRLGIQVDVMCNSGSEYEAIFTQEGMNVLGDFPANKKDKSAIQNIKDLIHANNYDIIHALHRKGIACAIKGVKGTNTKLVAYRGASGLYWHDPTAYENALNPRVDKVICVCDEIRRNISKQLFFKASKAVTIYKGHKMEWYKDILALDLKSLNVPEDAFVIACPANNRKWKGIPTFLDAIGLLPKNLNIHVLLLGTGMETPFYKEKIKNNANHDKIHVLGYRNDILKILAASQVVMQTSYKNEGLSRSTIEGMSQSVVPIVTEAGGNPELVEHEKCGLVVPIKNPKAMAAAIERLYANRDLHAQFSTAAKKRIAEHFTVENTAKQTIKLYKELLLQS